jgi:hypothetical protein
LQYLGYQNMRFLSSQGDFPGGSDNKADIRYISGKREGQYNGNIDRSMLSRFWKTNRKKMKKSVDKISEGYYIRGEQKANERQTNDCDEKGS